MFNKELLAKTMRRSFCCVLIGLLIGGMTGAVSIALV